MEALLEKTREKVEAKELASEIALALKDYFVAKVAQQGNAIKMQLEGGQEFYLTVREI
ncbi:MAG: hypothetical protein K2G44_05225 [Clostridia bacterium]|nr:hypothetical protein [Clostridia bacterium]